MTWWSAIALATRGLRRRPGRAVLTVLAVMLAATLLTALLTIATTAETRVLDELARGGPLAGIKVAAASPDPAQIGEDNARPGDPKDIDQRAVDRIRTLPGVRDVVPITGVKMIVVSRSTAKDGRTIPPFVDTVVGVDITQAPTLPITVLDGRLPAPGSLTEVAVSESYLQRLGFKRADAAAVVGTEVELDSGQAYDTGGRSGTWGRWTRGVIVGVVAQEAADGGILVPTEQVATARAWSDAGVTVPAAGQRASPYAGLFVVAETLDDVGRVREEIATVGYSTSAPENLIASVERYLHVVEIVLTAVGGIALVVAALGITNAMLAAVRERRREIGVIKAIGGRDRDIRRIFLVEAAVLGFVGGTLGAFAGWMVARAVGGVVNGYLNEQGLAGVELALPGVTMLGTMLGATLLAVLAGTLPAVRAARLPAREAVGAV